MITKSLSVFKKQVVIITALYTIALAIASFIRLKGLPEIGPAYSDKIFHFLAYGLLTGLWFFVLFLKFKWSKTKSLIISALSSIVFGTIIEALQSEITNTRVSESNDIIANTLGTFLTVLLVVFFVKTEVKKY